MIDPIETGRIGRTTPGALHRAAAASSPRERDVPVAADGYAGPASVRSPFTPRYVKAGSSAPLPEPSQAAQDLGGAVELGLVGRLLGVAGLALVAVGALAGCGAARPQAPPPPANSQVVPGPNATVSNRAQGSQATRPAQADSARRAVETAADLPPLGSGAYGDPWGTGPIPQVPPPTLPPIGTTAPDSGPNAPSSFPPPSQSLPPQTLPQTGMPPYIPSVPTVPEIPAPTIPTSPVVDPSTPDLDMRPGESFEDFINRMREAKQRALEEAGKTRPTQPDKPSQSRSNLGVTAHGYWSGNEYHSVSQIRIWEVNNYQNRTYNTYTGYGQPQSQSLTLGTARPGQTYRVQVTWDDGSARTYDVQADASGNATNFDAWRY